MRVSVCSLSCARARVKQRARVGRTSAYDLRLAVGASGEKLPRNYPRAVAPVRSCERSAFPIVRNAIAAFSPRPHAVLFRKAIQVLDV